jgi:hypothetical protein
MFRRAHGLSMMVNAAAMVAALLAWLVIASQHRISLSPAVTDPGRASAPLASRADS